MHIDKHKTLWEQALHFLIFTSLELCLQKIEQVKRSKNRPAKSGFLNAAANCAHPRPASSTREMRCS